MDGLGMNNPILNQYDNPTALEKALCDQVVAQLKAAITERGFAMLMVSGGQTPIPLFQRLAVQSLPWSKVWLCLADERWVAPTDQASNEASVRAHLLKEEAAMANFMSLYQGSDIETAPAHLRTTLPEKLFQQAFDVVILGMGSDGHTASWFPCANNIESVLKSSSPLMAVQPQTASHARITWTPQVVLQARQIFIHIVGANKKQVYDRALTHDDCFSMPIRKVLLQQQVPVHTYWSP
jgi:6-phosphogluconolactonase